MGGLDFKSNISKGRRAGKSNPYFSHIVGAFAAFFPAFSPSLVLGAAGSHAAQTPASHQDRETSPSCPGPTEQAGGPRTAHDAARHPLHPQQPHFCPGGGGNINWTRGSRVCDGGRRRRLTTHPARGPPSVRTCTNVSLARDFLPFLLPFPHLFPLSYFPI